MDLQQKIDQLDGRIQKLSDAVSRTAVRLEPLEKKINGALPNGNPAPWIEHAVLLRELSKQVDQLAEKLEHLEKRLVGVQIRTFGVALALVLFGALIKTVDLIH